MIKCPYCKESFDYQEIIIGKARSIKPYFDESGKGHSGKSENIESSHYILSCPRCQTFLGCSLVGSEY